MVGFVTPKKEARKWGVSARCRGITLIRTFYAYFPVFLAIIYNKEYGEVQYLGTTRPNTNRHRHRWHLLPGGQPLF